MEISASTAYEQFEEACRRYPDRAALRYLGEKYTYSELHEATDRLAASLVKLGMEKGSKAVILLPNCPQWVLSWLALLRIGAMAVPISPIYTPTDIKYMSNDSGAEIIFCMDTNFGYVSEVLPESSLKRVIVTNVAELLPFWKRAIGWGFNKIPTGKVAFGENAIPFKKLLKDGSPAKLPSFQGDSDDLISMLYTGGTTGQPKGVAYSNIVFLTSSDDMRLTSASIPKGENVVLQGAPLFHILGEVGGLASIFWGDTLILPPRVNLDGFFEYIEADKARTFFGVPTLYRTILEHDRLDYYNLSSLECAVGGGDVVPVEVIERWQRYFGKPLYQAYGITETCGVVSLIRPGEDFPLGTCGKISPRQQVKLVDPDTLEPVPPGEPGEILVRSEHMVTSYWNKPEETTQCFVEVDGQLWYRTRDILRIDKDGWAFYLDRSVDTIKHKGYRVAASEIEATLQNNPAVVAACVVGVPDTRVGERIKAFVVLKEDIKGVSAYDLNRWCRERLASYKVPQYIEFRDMLPKSKVGKLLRREMRADERKKLEKT
jgi:long-chain acyl-CoA synthetase